MYSTAIFYAEKLSRAPHASVADQVLLAKVSCDVCHRNLLFLVLSAFR